MMFQFVYKSSFIKELSANVYIVSKLKINNDVQATKKKVETKVSWETKQIKSQVNTIYANNCLLKLFMIIFKYFSNSFFTCNIFQNVLFSFIQQFHYVLKQTLIARQTY